jgi:hypothetical protein
VFTAASCLVAVVDLDVSVREGGVSGWPAEGQTVMLGAALAGLVVAEMAVAMLAIGALTAVPFLWVRGAGWRGPVLYLLLGAGLGLLSAVIVAGMSRVVFPEPGHNLARFWTVLRRFVLACGPAGLVGGLTYWLASGRWRPEPRIDVF